MFISKIRNYIYGRKRDVFVRLGIFSKFLITTFAFEYRLIYLTFAYQVIPRDGGYATLFAHSKSLFFAAVLIGMELYAHYYSYYEPLFMFLLGFWMCFVALVSHDGHHGSTSRTPWVNRVYRMGFNLFGESTLHWSHFHLGIVYTLAILFLQSSSIPNTKLCKMVCRHARTRPKRHAVGSATKAWGFSRTSSILAHKSALFMSSVYVDLVFIIFLRTRHENITETTKNNAAFHKQNMLSSVNIP